MAIDSLILLLSSVGVIQGVLLSGYSFQLKTGNKQSNILFGLLLLGISIRVGKSVFNHFLELGPFERNLGLAGFLMVGPSLWLYGKSLFNELADRSWVIVRHYLPSAIFILLGWIIPNELNDIGSWISYACVLIHLLTYVILSFRTIQKSVDKDKQTFKWYRNIVGGVFSIWIFYLGIFTRAIPSYIGGAIFYTLLIYYLTYLWLKLHHFNLEKYGGNTIDRLEADHLLDKLEKALVQDQLHLKNDLTLDELALKLEIPSRKLSQLVNERKGQNFVSYINTLRIEEAKKLLCDESMQPQSIAGVAFDSGFNNVASFNQAFKKFTGLTPSAYRKENS